MARNARMITRQTFACKENVLGINNKIQHHYPMSNCGNIQYASHATLNCDRRLVRIKISFSLGCDKILGSPLTEDSCGICGGDDSNCRLRERNFKGENIQGRKKIAFLPKGARSINIKINELKVKVFG